MSNAEDRAFELLAIAEMLLQPEKFDEFYPYLVKAGYK